MTLDGMPLGEDVGPAVDAFLGTRPARPRVLAMGEPTHQEEVFLVRRNQIFQHVVARHGFRAIALESDCLAGLVVNDFVVDGAGSIDEVLKTGFSHGFGELESSRALVEWMRSYNENRPRPERLRFFGADAPTEMMFASSPRQAITALNTYLGSPYEVDELLGPDERWSDSQAMLDPTKSVGSSEDVGKLRLIVDDLRGLLTAETPCLIAQSRDDWWRAQLHGRAAAALLRYHKGMAVNSDARFEPLLSIRDALMAENILAALDHGRIFVFAHNAHLQREQAGMTFAGATQRWWGAGSIVSAVLGSEYAFLASAVGFAPHWDISAPPADTVEGVLSALPGDYIVDSSSIDTTGLRQRPNETYRYWGLDPAHIKDTDGLIFFKTVPRLSGSASAAAR